MLDRILRPAKTICAKVLSRRRYLLLGAGLALLIVVLYATLAPKAAVEMPYVQNVSPHSATIVLRLRKARAAELRYGPTRKCPQVQFAGTQETLHKFVLDGLSPGTTYYYKVGGGFRSGVHRFTTAPSGPEPFKFVVYGDNRGYPERHSAVARLIQKEAPDFILHTGDLLDNGDDYGLWGTEFFGPLKEVLPGIPLYPTHGNHDGSPTGNYKKLFSLPGDGIRYSFRWSNAEFFTFDSDVKAGALLDAAKWLDEQLAASKADWKIVWSHYPIFSSGEHTMHTGLREAIEPVLSRNRVPIVFAGHNHGYERTVGIVSRSCEGCAPVQYVITGGGGANVHSFRKVTWDELALPIHHICTVAVNGRHLSFAAIGLDGKVFDRLELDRDGKPARTAYAEDVIRDEVFRSRAVPE